MPFTDTSDSRKTGVPFRRLWLPLVSAAFFFVGCAPNIGRLAAQVDAGAFDGAMKAVLGDPEMESELALLILQKGASVASNAFRFVDILAAGGRGGRRALKRMAKKSDLSGRLARIALSDRGDPNEALLTLCDDDFGDVRTACVRRFYPVMTAGQLKRRLLDTDPRARLFALRAIVATGNGPETSRLLRQAFRQDPSSKVRAEAAAAGPLLGDDALLLLRPALSDTNQGVQLAAIKGIAALKTDVANKTLEEIAVSGMDVKTVAAATELARLGIPLGIERLEAALEDSRPVIRKAALLRLERADLSERHQKYAKMLEDAAPEVVLLAAGLLRNDTRHRAEVVRALQALFKKKVKGSDAARDQLATFGESAAVSAVRKALTDADAAELLSIIGRIGGAPDLRPDIVMLMGDDRREIREAAAEAVLSNSPKN